MTPAFLLTRHWQDADQGVRLEFWLSTASGPLQIFLHGQRPIFFIHQSEASRVEQLMHDWSGVSIKPLELKTFKFDAVSGVYFESQRQLYRARDLLSQHRLACYESDIRPTDRFLNERFITASVNVESEFSNQAIENVGLKPGDYTPGLTVMSIDIETDYQNDALFSIAFVSQQVKKTLIIG